MICKRGVIVAINRKLLKNFDFGLLINVILLCVIGIVTISSATQAFKGGTNRFFIVQIIWTVLGIGLLILTSVIDYNVYKMYYKLIYVVNIMMLCVVVVLGKVTNGANSWIGIGTLGIQPSEIMKISLIIVIAKKIEDFEGGINSVKNLGILFLYSIVPLGLILMQPDLGTAMVFVAIIIGMLFMGGLNIRIFVAGILITVITLTCVWYSPIQILKPYQKDRILIFLNPENDQLKSGYHIIQSKIAIGSGQLFGMGLGKGLQNEGKFLPESHTDFIFSVFGEEFGFVGAIVLVVLYASLIFKCLNTTRVAKDTFGSLVIIGVISMLVFQMFQNIGMTIGLMPITGITLPFVSYGGSSMLTSMISIGLILNIGMRRHKINF